MARSSKYASINFNEIFEKKVSSPNPSKSASSSSSSPYSGTLVNNGSNTTLYKSHLTQGRMLVLSRPSPKPVAVPQPQPQPQPKPQPPATSPQPDADPISLRPLGRTGAGSPLSSPVPIQERDKEVVIPVTSPKPNKFVPPHLRPGFTGKEERPGPEVQKQVGQRIREPGQRNQGTYGSPGRYGEDGRPKSGGYDRMRRGEADLSRSISFGNRPSSSG